MSWPSTPCSGSMAGYMSLAANAVRPAWSCARNSVSSVSVAASARACSGLKSATSFTSSGSKRVFRYVPHWASMSLRACWMDWMPWSAVIAPSRTLCAASTMFTAYRSATILISLSGTTRSSYTDFRPELAWPRPKRPMAPTISKKAHSAPSKIIKRVEILYRFIVALRMSAARSCAERAIVATYCSVLFIRYKLPMPSNNAFRRSEQPEGRSGGKGRDATRCTAVRCGAVAC